MTFKVYFKRLGIGTSDDHFVDFDMIIRIYYHLKKHEKRKKWGITQLLSQSQSKVLFIWEFKNL